MAPLAAASPATPQAYRSPGSESKNTPTGTWRHPRFDEITRRQNASTFNDKSVARLLYNGLVFLGTFLLTALPEIFPRAFHALSFLSPYYWYALLLTRLLLLFNISVAVYPLFRRKDELADIPLTPSQRALLGLNPNSGSPATTPDQYITPPRYRRSSTPRSGSPVSGSSTYSSSPLSGRASLNAAGSSYSPSPSPLLQKAVSSGQRNLNRRSSYGTGSPFGVSFNGKESLGFGVSSSPSPTIGKGASVPLNSRWLYERGRASPAGYRDLYS
ncbi:hypothetical protein L228DRAFT_249964 [Xylona heveae TC161]|uniref:Nuclear pore complex component n=1 Tax=Xylona heveae (strain CBS 132557 / TC161) TaxID=1328760 RepID=A0A165ADD9_XYLHT|nr:hypothetical protein L228DRAFT_249964 [Xylona heveae TC161]KZF20293.1 hypothetical protein L228DRAFT_249964 [Xylona heveae TC161]